MSVVTRSLTFAYPNSTQGLHNIDLTLPLGGKILLVGPNGAGKSTLLKILAGKKLISSGEIELFGIDPFNLRENWKLNEKNIVYLGTEWANNEIVKRDIGVHELVESVGGSHFPERRALLIDILEIDVNWRMNKCSDGERRRVQLAMGLLKPFDLLLLDEVTIDLDVLVRQKLLNFLYDETTTRNASIIYATHIFDGLGTWPDTVIHLNRGEIAESHNRNNISFTNTPGSKSECIKPERYGENQPSNSNDEYTKFLEKKIRQLEKMLDLKVKNKLNDVKLNNSKLTQNDEKILNYKKIGMHIDYSNGRNNNSGNAGSRNSNDSSSSGADDNGDNNINEIFDIVKMIKIDPVLKIDSKLSENLTSLYFKMMQYKFPLLDEVEITNFNRNYQNNKVLQNDLNNCYFQCSRLFFIYSLSALLFKSTGKYKGPNPFNFFSAGLRFFILLSNNINQLDKIELLILMCMFLIRADKNSNNIYLIITEIMNNCINLNLHKSSTYLNINPLVKDLRMRKFWCAYILERSILITISKPFILSESEIDDNIPLFDYEPSKFSKKGKVFFINQSIKIKRLESKFSEDLLLLLPSKSISKNQLAKVESYFQELQNWRIECKGFNSNGIENQTLLFYYYKAIRNLIQPYLELLDPNDRLFKECQAAAGQICQSIKNYHSKTYHGFSILNIHIVFIAGITLVYCLWLQRNRDDMRRKLLGDDKKHTRPTVSEDLFRGLDDLRACSISLYTMSERTKFALSFRDIFEEIMNATIGNYILRCGPDSSEILYRGSGLPPAIFRKPLKHFQIESNYLDKSDDDKLEDEERLRRRGHLKRSAIPKGLSHLLLHPPGLEDLKHDSMRDESVNRDDLASSSKSNSRILPPPITLPIPKQQRLSTSLTSNDSNLARKYSQIHDVADANSSLLSSNSPNSRHDLLKHLLAATSTSTATTTTYATGKSRTPSTTSTTSTPATTATTTTNTHHYYNQQDNPDSLSGSLPFVGGTNEMITNISTWTEESGQQTGLPKGDSTNLDINLDINSLQQLTNNNFQDSSIQNTNLDSIQGSSLQNGVTDTFNSLFDVVGNDDFWGLSRDFGFMP
ncbi:hypothetical protein CAS74_002013 [Pichia kudriavzevii]|uniref:ABC transporter domain-containing protein n=1 Tax=Pichia kudriavzevii TaxID=4909 RepID=A0A1Z8JNY3_PICKU|nr:hypothetical protein CAS74_002013 [Pichia kudriavzevii]